ncbi:pectate lyase [Vibrio algarum]|uniref:Pectate lyase n=1 Tax=Vibrio algarum TaxID=3020714 RepID=A0ABT4YX22_9VIBR|nr:pectate lyase [Vibrio sp. KJ40-1]MDB1125942.1 pectate lyase [Vibrio sp. KJ40-1]
MSDSRLSFIPILKQYYQHAYELAKGPGSPLLADGIEVRTSSPAHWCYPDGHTAPMSNFASQQNFIRGLIALEVVTGEAKFKHQAIETVQYFLNHYVDSESGLFHWGGHRFVNLLSGQIEGPASKECVHELKHHFPFYDLLHEVEPTKTERFLRGFWQSHISNWETLDLSRHGEYGKECPENVFQQFEPKPVVDPEKWPELPQTVGLTFVNASTDLIYAACYYYKYTSDVDAKKWAKHLYRQFVLARNPHTGMPVYQFSSPLQREPVPTDDKITFSWFGDRAKRQFGKEFGEIAKEANALFRDCWPVVVDNPMAILECAELTQDTDMALWAVEGIKAYFKYAWDEQKNQILPMWNDGVDLSGLTFKRDGYYGSKGTQLSPQKNDPAYLLTLVRACANSTDKALRELTVKMFKRFGLGDLHPETLKPNTLSSETEIASPYLVFALLELIELTGTREFLALTQVVGENLLRTHYHFGFFIPSEKHKYARLDDPIPYALIAIEAANQGQYQKIPIAISTGGYLHGDQSIDGKEKVVYDYEVVYNQIV